ncbi:pyroglutamyl peptidase [Nocardiopsis composta]|uniref:Pyrrolidone-carboxylate peptidase n=1 Tax=Nocardiopsis composta TaxID=157465 RepID=A0A7W8QIE3_9ACTN|nr:pyroglutamyl peptidase [Nocardiopsis composta]MBB5430323.1 pyrrolidone-carboxylate peptidase [Nocardiopsis composta]
MPVRNPAPRIAAAALVLAPALALTAPAHAAPGGDPACLGAGGATVEEERLAEEVPQEILRRSGFADRADDFARELCAAPDLDAAGAAVREHGERLWRDAVRRVQADSAAEGELSAGDDRPLYWARLGMTSALRRWEPSFELGAGERAGLLAELERRSRGQSGTGFDGADRDALRVVVTGFDPFRLDNDIRQANPSGAAALALDGAVLKTADGRTAVVQTAMFPVRWRDFTDGMVERALAPHYTADRPADAVITVSQGREGRFDLEAHNGAWRGGSDDNESTGTAETVPVPEGFPTVIPQPQWSDSTLDRPAIVEAVSGEPFPVVDNTEVTEIPAGETEPVVRPDGPTPGSEARAGGGGDYLSNEIAYRNTLLRDATGLDVPAGHVHTPILHLGGDTGVTDPAFERDRAAIVAQVEAIVAAALGTGGTEG